MASEVFGSAVAFLKKTAEDPWSARKATAPWEELFTEGAVGELEQQQAADV